jgi:hypothetical protein
MIIGRRRHREHPQPTLFTTTTGVAQLPLAHTQGNPERGQVKRYGKYGRKQSWIVKRYGKYRRNQSWIVKWYGKYGRKASRIVKRFGKYRRKLWKDMKNMENMEEKFFFSFYKTINTACNLFKFTLCPTVRGNNSLSEGIHL